MRLSGFASGLDIDNMVKELMQARRKTYDNLVKDRTKVEWQREDYRSMNAKIIDFRNNKLASFNLSNSINAKSTELSGATSSIMMNATNSTASGTLNVEVTQVATSENHVYTFGTGDLGSVGFLEDPANPSNVKITINGSSISLAKTASLDELAKAINSNSSSLKATALYNADTGQFSIAATKTGEGMLELTDPIFDTPDSSRVGKNAIVNINGINYEQSSNRFNVNGFDFTVKESTNPGETVSLTAVQDTSKIIDTIKSFVTEYNSLISSINSEVSEANYRSYKPLSSAEKKEMTEDEIEKWEEKARSGTLRNDSTLSQLVSELRITATSLISGVVDGNGDKISIGISTGSYTEKGKLILDEEKLRDALDANSDAVIDLFTNSSTGVFKQMSASSMTALKGLSDKAGTSLTSTDLNGTFKEDSVIGRELREMKKREDALMDRLNRMETQYYKQFTAMEKAINRFNSQAGMLSSFMSS
ncbi:flagellar filament capping protein FliD [Paenibacillus chungangensis]|uniref:Flagellar hook-associated protein 2 n=1 Tax=Paenibacillus chungangensis TaxID=696535 RepID=A0ABW3HWZ4_9BACL